MPTGISLPITRMTRLEIKRRHQELTIYQLAWRSGVSEQTIKKHEQGVRNTYIYDTIYKLRDALGIEQSDLVRGKGDIWEGGGKVWWRRFDGTWVEINPFRQRTRMAEWVDTSANLTDRQWILTR